MKNKWLYVIVVATKKKKKETITNSAYELFYYSHIHYATDILELLNVTILP